MILTSVAVSGGAWAAAICTGSATGIAFGRYNQLSSSPVDSTITVQCSKDSGAPTILNYTILLSAGQSGSFAPRKMASGANRFGYNLYTDAARLRVWDTGASGAVTVSSAVNLRLRGKSVDPANFGVYGCMPGGQNVPAGSYSDTNTVTVNYQ
ncbi:MAG TPA: spore coat U domain-containing protein [Gammaproteobacteria bacterium]|nr:spore coat U domain-containing protein [Gammaproteobacteria bacterium]